LPGLPRPGIPSFDEEGVNVMLRVRSVWRVGLAVVCAMSALGATGSLTQRAAAAFQMSCGGAAPDPTLWPAPLEPSIPTYSWTLGAPTTCAGSYAGPNNFSLQIDCYTALAGQCTTMDFDLLVGTPQTGCSQFSPAHQEGLQVEGSCTTPDGSTLAFELDYEPVDYTITIDLTS
jgi:hypothetical protein